MPPLEAGSEGSHNPGGRQEQPNWDALGLLQEGSGRRQTDEPGRLQLVQDSEGHGPRPMIPDYPLSIEQFRHNFEHHPPDAIHPDRLIDPDEIPYKGSSLSALRDNRGNPNGLEIRSDGGNSSAFKRLPNGDLELTAKYVSGQSEKFTFDKDGNPRVRDTDGHPAGGYRYAKMDVGASGDVRVQVGWNGEDRDYRIGGGVHSEINYLSKGTPHEQSSSYVQMAGERHIKLTGPSGTQTEFTNLRTGETVAVHDQNGYRREVHDRNGIFTEESYMPKDGKGQTYVWRPGKPIEVQQNM